jgi:hypothetical protein
VDLIAVILALYAIYLTIKIIYPPPFSFPPSSSLIQIISFIFSAIIISRFGKYILNEYSQISNNLNNEIIGVINVYGEISLLELSKKFKMKPEETEKWIAKLNTEKKFEGRIDKNTMKVYGKSAEQENIFKLESQTEIVESKSERIKRLEELFKEGKISEQVYSQLKKEYENE